MKGRIQVYTRELEKIRAQVMAMRYEAMQDEFLDQSDQLNINAQCAYVIASILDAVDAVNYGLKRDTLCATQR